MIAIYYLNDEPFFCESITGKSAQDLMKDNRFLLGGPILFSITGKVKSHNKIHVGLGDFYSGIEHNDIKNYYGKMGDNVKPVWVENDYGRQITFLINE